MIFNFSNSTVLSQSFIFNSFLNSSSANINFGLFPDVQSKEINGQKINKKNRRKMLSTQALHHSKIWSQKINKLLNNI